MTRLSIAVSCLTLLACAAEAPVPADALMEGEGEVEGVRGLARLEGAGPFQSGATERFRVHVDEAQVTKVEWSASAGALSASGRVAEWRLPATSTAELSVRVTRRDGASGTVTWRFALTPAVDSSRPMTAQAALLATPMPVLDGGTLEVSGGGCEVRYEGTSNNVAIAFTTATHPSLVYGRWAGSAWSLEVVDAMGFNTGGVIGQYVSMQVEANGTPHLVYLRNDTVMYATKSAGTWVRERVDGPGAVAMASVSAESAPSLALSGTSPVVLYTADLGAFYRAAISTRTGPGTWTRSVVAPVAATSSSVYSYGELAIDSSGRHLFAALDFTAASSAARHQLVAWTASTRSSVTLPQPLDSRADVAWAGSARLLSRTRAGLYDVALSPTFASTTMTYSAVELSGSNVGDLAWAPSASRPVLLHHHFGSLELVTPNAAGFWTYTQLGTSSGASAGLTVHPTTGEASICYQSGGRIMFQ